MFLDPGRMDRTELYLVPSSQLEELGDLARQLFPRHEVTFVCRSGLDWFDAGDLVAAHQLDEDQELQFTLLVSPPLAESQLALWAISRRRHQTVSRNLGG